MSEGLNIGLCVVFVEQNKREGVVAGREVRGGRENKSEKSGRVK